MAEDAGKITADFFLCIRPVTPHPQIDDRRGLKAVQLCDEPYRGTAGVLMCVIHLVRINLPARVIRKV